MKSMTAEKQLPRRSVGDATADRQRERSLDALWRRDSLHFDRETAAVCAALSFAADDPPRLTAQLKALGFDRLCVSALDNTDPARIGLAVAAAHKGSESLVAVILRGSQAAEWYGNFRIGFCPEHRGFALAADYAEEKLTGCLPVRDGGKLHFLVTGYSRGGAAANLLARRLCDRWGVDAVRCYTFAAPHTALSRRDARYDSIYNLVREEDFFTRVPLESWGYARYGHTLTLGGDIREAYRALTGEAYTGVTDAAETQQVLDAVQSLAPSVHAYYHRRFPVGDCLLSLYDYMTAVAALLAGDADEAAGEILLDSLASPYAQLTDFLSAGMDLTALFAPSQALPRCRVADSHRPAAYLAAMKAARILD